MSHVVLTVAKFMKRDLSECKQGLLARTVITDIMQVPNGKGVATGGVCDPSYVSTNAVGEHVPSVQRLGSFVEDAEALSC